jgi:DNA topoisomerase-2
LNITNMHLFNEDGVITKYSSPIAILEAFIPLRLKAYSQRREMLIRLAESQLKRLSNKMRFILAVVDGSLVVNRKKKQELIAELEALCYDRLPKTDKGSIAEIDEDGEFIANDVAGSYDYLLGMPLWNLTLEKVDELCAEKESKEAEVAELHKTTEKDLWMKDLDTLERTLELLDAEDEEARAVLEKQQRAAARNNTTAGKKAAKKKMAKQRAANSSDEDEWDDDFSDEDFEIAKPKKAAAKPKAVAKPKTAPERAPAPAAKDEREVEEAEPMSLAERLALRGGTTLSKPAESKPVSAFNMSSISAAVDDVVPKPAPAKKLTAPKRAPAKKAIVASDSEEDFDDESDSEVAAPVAPRSTARPARARPAKSYAVSDSEESEDDFSEEDDDDESDFSESE